MANNKITVAQLLSTPQAYDLQTVLKQQPRLLENLIDFISLMPDPFIMNQLQCYVFPQKAIQILTQATIYQVVVYKRDRLNPKTNQNQAYYPYLHRLFTNFLKTDTTQEILLGYVNRLLISLVKKTPEIYEFFKGQPQVISAILSSDKLLDNLKDFLSWFIVQSTMELYIFLKSIFIRTLFSRIIQGDTSPILFALIGRIYQDVVNRYKHCMPEDKQQLFQLKKNFQDQDWVNLLLLKIGHQRPQTTYQISKLINIIIEENSEILQGFDKIHYEHLSQFFIDYEDSSDFMIVIHRYHTEVLKLLLKCIQKSQDNRQNLCQQLLKRLLVYCTVHENVTHLQNLLFELICYLKQQKLYHIYKQANVITFLHKNTSESKHKYGLKVLLERICIDWKQHEDLLKQLSEDDQNIIKSIYDKRKNALESCKFYSFKSKAKQSSINENKPQQKASETPKKDNTAQQSQKTAEKQDNNQQKS